MYSQNPFINYSKFKAKGERLALPRLFIFKNKQNGEILKLYKKRGESKIPERSRAADFCVPTLKLKSFSSIHTGT